MTTMPGATPDPGAVTPDATPVPATPAPATTVPGVVTVSPEGTDPFVTTVTTASGATRTVIVPRRRRGWRIALRLASWALSVILVLALAVAGLVYWSVHRAFPDHDGVLKLPGLAAPVTVYRDAFGIPQLYARTADDLFQAQGYVHAQDRFWEMDFRRHVTSGRLSELFGADQVSTDAFLRTMGWRRVAEQEWQMLSAEARGYFTAYANGVNAWIADNGGPSATGAKSFEYSVLSLTNRGYTVEQWDPVDSLAWLKAMAWDLRGNMTSEITRALLLAHGLTRSQVEQLYPAYPYERNRPIVPTGGIVDGTFDLHPPTTGTQAVRAGDGGSVWRDAASALSALSRSIDALPLGLGEGGDADAGTGSNSWVISGSLTSTGKPILANDPHLSPSMPGIWYQMGLHCDCTFNAEGFTFSGVPGVVIGHNERVAWGFTNLGPDVTDLYLERVDGDRVLVGSEWVPLTTRTEVIKVAGGDPVSITVRASKHGPLLSDRSEELTTLAARPAVDPSGSPLASVSPAAVPSLDPASPDVPAAAKGATYAVALRWTALDPGRTGEALFAIDKATSFADLRAAAALFEVPAQNIIYADIDGNIGYQSPGRIPIRGKGDGNWPAPGWDPAYDWQGFIPFFELPNELNPNEGWIVTANQAVIGPQYGRHLTDDWAYGYRSQRVMDMVREHTARRKIGPDDIRLMQFDNRNNFAATVVPALLAVAVSGEAGTARELLREWDFQQPAQNPPQTSAAAAFYNATWSHLLARTFDELPDERKPAGGDRWFEVMRSLLTQPDSPWWDDQATSNREDRDEILAAAMIDAQRDLSRRLGPDPLSWRWGNLHTLTLENATFGKSGIAPIEYLFNRGPAGVSGGSDIVNATAWSADEGYAVDQVPSMRMIVDLSNMDASRWVQLTGNSGHAYHRNYNDQFDVWRFGGYLPMRWDRGLIESEAKHVLTLTP